MRPSRASLALAALALALVASGCGTDRPDDSDGPGGSGSPAPAASLPASLDEARARWADAGITDYRLVVTTRCFCVPVTVDVAVTGGVAGEPQVSSADPTMGEPPPGSGESVPQTVPALLDVVAGAEDAAALEVTYDRRGVPLRIWIDTSEQMADEEIGYSVALFADDGTAAPDGADVWSEQPWPIASTDPLDLPQMAAPARATYADGRLHLAFWGSSSCPTRPVTLDPVETPTARAGQRTVLVGADDTQPFDTACTADFGPTAYAAALAGGADLVVVEVATGNADTPGLASYAVDVVAAV
jgi:hypothetical protein